MPSNKPSIAYVVYSPPAKGLPFLAVTLKPDGSVTARQFDTVEEAESFTRGMAKGLRPDSIRH